MPAGVVLYLLEADQGERGEPPRPPSSGGRFPSELDQRVP